MKELLKGIAVVTFISLAVVGTAAIVTHAQDGNLDKLDSSLKKIEEKRRKKITRMKQEVNRKLNEVARDANQAAKNLFKS